jgi:cytoskeletal protein RodZ
LAEARAQAGLSLDEVSERTRIRRTLVENIERDDFHACGGDFYARGHIKSIAQALHLDPAPLLAEFDGEHPTDAIPTASGVLERSHTEAASVRADGRRPNWSVAMAAVLALVVVVGGYQALNSDDGSGSGSVVADAPVNGGDSSGSDGDSGRDEGSADSGGASDSDTDSDRGSAADPSVEPQDEPTVLADATEGVEVTLLASSGRSWVSATGSDSSVLYEGILGDGDSQVLTDDDEVRLVLGNAGSVDLTVNGRTLGIAGNEGEVVRLTFGPGDPELGAA